MKHSMTLAILLMAGPEVANRDGAACRGVRGPASMSIQDAAADADDGS